jgi:plastocyanin
MRPWLKVLALPLAVAMGACQVTDQGQVIGPTVPGVNVADISGFTPSTLTVSAGDSVTFSWFGNNTYSHNVTFTSDTVLHSPTQRSGLFTVTFPNPGTYNYQCTVHGEKGVVIVH